MKKSWGLLPMVISGEKTVESRWSQTRRPPWGQVKKGDTLYFKNSGDSVTVKARVTKVIQIDNLTPIKRQAILTQYGRADLGIDPAEMTEELKTYLCNKKYCLLVFFDQVKKVIPFNIDKTGYGAMSAWLSCNDIEEVRLKEI